MSEWKKVKIGDICKIVKGTTGIASAEPGEYPLVVTAEERKTCSTYQFDCEAVCIPLVSSSGHGKKSLKNVHYQSGKFALGTILCAVIPNNPQELDARYLHQYLQFYKDIILVPLMKGAANVSLSMKDIMAVEFPLPPIERQRELSNLFVSLQEKQKELSAEYEKQTDYAKLLRQNILQEAIEGKLTTAWRKQNPVQKGNPDYDAEALFEQIQKGEVSPSLQPASQFSATPSPRGKAPKTPKNSREFFEEKLDSERKRTNNARSKSLAPITDEEKPFEIPEGWKWVRLGEICEYIHRGKSPKYGNDEILPIIAQKCNQWDKIYTNKCLFAEKSSIEKYLPEQYLQLGDVIINSTGGGTVGRTGFIKEYVFSNYKQFVADSHVTVVRGNKLLKKELIYYYLISPYIQIGLEERCNGSTNQLELATSTVNEYMFPLPPLEEQEEIVTKVETLFAKVTTLESQIQDRKSLSDKLIFGIIKENLEG